MKKIIILGLVLTFIAPHIVLASWWNPFSWNVFNRKDQKTLILENKVKELESRLNKVDSVQVTSSKSLDTKELNTKPLEKKDSKELLNKQNMIRRDEETLLTKQKTEKENQIKVDLAEKGEKKRVSEIQAKIEANQLKINELNRQYSQGILPLTRDQQDEINAIQRSYDNAIAKQKEANQSQESIVRQSAFRGGSEYTPNTPSIITNVIDSNALKISEYENEARLAIASMKLKYLEINYQTLLEYYNTIGRQLEQSL